jgi:hypothetical protein
MPERHQSFTIPALVLIMAFVAALIGLTGWTAAQLNTKADAVSVEKELAKKADAVILDMICQRLAAIEADVKSLLRTRPGS